MYGSLLECGRVNLSRSDILGKSIHFIGMGGSGIAPLAEIAISYGCNVSGSDLHESASTKRLVSLGANFFAGHSAENITDFDFVVYSGAIKEENPELVAAYTRKIKTLKRSEFLGLIANGCDDLIAVSGSHGKTTASAMITSILMDLGKNPTAIVGSEMIDLGCGGVAGGTRFCVCEACEFQDSFLYLKPSLGVILNVDNDHLDYFGDIENEKKSFEKFALKCSKALIINADDLNSVECVKDVEVKKIFYSLNPGSDVYAQNISLDDSVCASFDAVVGENRVRINLNVPGEHNVYNALAAISVCEFLGISVEACQEPLRLFNGTKRRFEKIGESCSVAVIDDFAHHPREIIAAYNTASKLNAKRVWAVFQPHTFSRTFFLFEEFVQALSNFKNVILTDILPVREINTYGIKAEQLAERIENCHCLGSFENISEFFFQNACEGDLILTMGGGNIYKCAHMILEKLKLREKNKVNQ
ncbi:MAG: UDP-N-acetylmuramate--L-alanine ligase [Oscillospiraceae bacterium]|jgi:UDP-N-acetylmuramate--alanine ligase|nr:UDP-N-acetylmuramate--L-alanine ligase [Oscillospiraceae bacterium]